jgi:adenylate kinase family enzyme
MLGADDPVTWSPRRIAVAGITGAGKTTLARRITAATGIPHTEIDGLFHGEGWMRRPTFETDVDAVTAGPSWVVEWQYPTAREVIAARADTMVWLDLPTRVSLYRVTARTIRRRHSNEQLWSGNREGPLLDFFSDPDHLIRWAIRTRNKLTWMVPDAQSGHPHLTVVRLRSQREVDRWMTQLTGGAV